jgi:hypothetical protein
VIEILRQFLTSSDVEELRTLPSRTHLILQFTIGNSDISLDVIDAISNCMRIAEKLINDAGISTSASATGHTSTRQI